MLVYLVRHGEAMDQMEDTSRPLSKRGMRDIQSVADLLALKFNLLPGHVYHSPKLRAVQTASIFCSSLPRAPVPEETDGLAPMDDPEIWVQRLETLEKDTMLVGHMPYMSRIASQLLFHDEGRDVFDFTPGTVLCLEKTGKWRVKWMVSPDTLKNP